jgi:O-antigen/teichoic acid export membrane protein
MSATAISASGRVVQADPILRVLDFLTLDATAEDVRWPAARRFAGIAWRYGSSAAGPVSIAGAHFIAALIFLNDLSRTEFGLFSFLLVVVPFCMSITGSLVGAPLSNTLTRAANIDERELSTFFKMNILTACVAATLVFAMMLFAGAPMIAALLLGAYGGTMVVRWFARCFAYVGHTPFRAVSCDFLYSGMLIAALLTLTLIHRLTIESGAVALLACAVLSLPAFGADYLRKQIRPGRAGSLMAYLPIWRDLTRWSALGVLLTEFTANAHAYLVTFISGPSSFALLALGSLVMRPVSLVFSALPDMERPIMGRAIAAGNSAGAFRTVNEFRTATSAVWAATLLLAGVLLTWFPHILLKKGYDETQVIAVIAMWSAIMLVRAIRTPENVFLQAAGEYKGLARASMRSSIVSMVLTLALLIAFGPIVSLGGVLAGDITMTIAIFSLTKAWKARHA